MKALKRTLIILAIVLALGLVGTLGGYFWYRSSHIKVNGTVYAKNTTAVDLRGQNATVEDVKALRLALPNAVVTWNVPFQGGVLPDDTTEITVTSLTMEDVDALNYLPGLTHVIATECRDYAALAALQEQKPNCQVDFMIHLGDRALERDTQSLTVANGEAVTAQELQDAMANLPQLTEVFLENPAVPAADLKALQEQYPDVQIRWNKEFLGQTYEMDLKELQIVDQHPGTLQELEDTLAYFPEFEKIYLEEAGYSDDELADLRERVRDQYQVVWMVHVGPGHLRTDDIGFIPSNSGWRITNEDANQLKYCEGLLAVDFGHTNTGNLSWVSGTPHLKYLIMGDGNIFNEDITHLSCLKELEFLEIFMCPVTDVSPLKECTALRDLLLSNCYVGLEPLAEMPWLENLWLSGSGVDAEEKAFLQENLPDTYIMTAGTGGHGYGWRKLPRYFEMRDTLGMYYMEG